MAYEPVTWIERAVYEKIELAWGWMEVNGWTALGCLVLFLFLLPYIQQTFRSLRAKAYAPSAEKVMDYQERQRLARLRQEEQAKRAAEEFAEAQREKKARETEEAKNLGLRARSGGRRLGSGSDDDVASPPPPTTKPKPKSKKHSNDDPFRRARERNPLAPDSSRGYAPPRRKVNTGGG